MPANISNTSASAAYNRVWRFFSVIWENRAERTRRRWDKTARKRVFAVVEHTRSGKRRRGRRGPSRRDRQQPGMRRGEGARDKGKPSFVPTHRTQSVRAPEKSRPLSSYITRESPFSRDTRTAHAHTHTHARAKRGAPFHGTTIRGHNSDYAARDITFRFLCRGSRVQARISSTCAV